MTPVSSPDVPCFTLFPVERLNQIKVLTSTPDGPLSLSLSLSLSLILMLPSLTLLLVKLSTGGRQ